jgi:hypothetical protein
MIWGLLGLIIVVVLLALAITNKNIGRALPLAGATIIGIIGFLAWYQDHERTLSKQRIPVSEVELVDLRLTDGARGAKEISGRIRNHSRNFTLVELRIQASMEDCIDDHCEVINQTDVTLKPAIPPEQARDFHERIYFQTVPAPRGQVTLNYQVISTRGE